jgi:hypothetical protein
MTTKNDLTRSAELVQTEAPQHAPTVVAHTKGPWTACKQGSCDCGFIWDASENIHVATAHDVSALGTDYYGSGLAVSAEEREANARLIAAAPELLEALKSVIESEALSSVEQLVTGWRGPADKPNPDHAKNLGATIRTTCGRMYRLDAALKMVSAAIAKAEGRA